MTEDYDTVFNINIAGSYLFVEAFLSATFAFEIKNQNKNQGNLKIT